MCVVVLSAGLLSWLLACSSWTTAGSCCWVAADNVTLTNRRYLLHNKGRGGRDKGQEVREGTEREGGGVQTGEEKFRGSYTFFELTSKFFSNIFEILD